MRTLRSLLSWRFALVAGTPVLLMALLFALVLLPQIRAEVHETHRALAEDIAAQTRTFLRGPSTTLHSVAGMIEALPRLDASEIERVLDAHVDADRIFETIYLTDAAGVVDAVGLPPERRGYRDDYRGIKLAARPFFSRAIASGSSAWSSTFLSVVSGQSAVAQASPTANGMVVVGEINLENLSGHMLDVESAAATQTLVLDQHGQIIAHPDRALSKQQVNIGHLPIVKIGLAGGVATQPFTMDGRRLLGTVVNLGSPNWLVLVTQPEAVAYRQIYTTGYILAFGLLVAAALAVGAGVLMAGRLSGRFEQMARHAGLIAGGIYDASLPANSIAELNLVGASLNHMRDAVRVREQLLEESERNYREVVEGTADLILRVDGEGRFTFVNHAALRVTGLAPAKCIGLSLFDFVHADDVTGMRTAFRRWVERRITNATFENRFVSRRGDVYHMLWTVSVLLDEKGEVTELFAIGRDISDRKSAEARLRLAATVYESTIEGVIVTDAQHRIVAVNKALAQITGYSEAELLGKTPRVLRSGRHGAAFYAGLMRQLTSFGQWHGEIWNRRKNGEIYPEWLTISAVKDEQGVVTNYVGVSSDITRIKQSQERLDFLAYHDPLTGLPNRLLFDDRLRHSLERASREGRQVAVLFVDIDHFKDVNDTLGHPLGDELLTHIALRLGSAVRADDTLSRLGGDEFVLLLESLDEALGASAVAEKLLASLNEPIVVSGHELYVGASIGISLFPGDGTDGQTLLKNADAAMYRAKQSGRGTYRFYHAKMTQQASERMQLEAMLRHALDNNEVLLHYQPQVDMTTRALIGVEALLRWQHPELGMVPPLRFIPLAEETGFIHVLGDWVLRSACRQLKQWQNDGIAVPKVAVNLSVKQLERGNIVELVSAALADSGLDPACLELEITESMLMRGEDAFTTIEQLRRLGVGLSIDDFGTGYSSLTYLKRLPVQQLKIDRSFVSDIVADRSDEAIALAIITLATSLGLSVIAEGVETEHQANLLVSKGCRNAQGFFYSRPLPPDQLVAQWGKPGLAERV
jgi:diguanylate cyclase (GGDEF)-like protein/PAS domain S-box-containing protein